MPDPYAQSVRVSSNYRKAEHDLVTNLRYTRRGGVAEEKPEENVDAEGYEVDASRSRLGFYSRNSLR